MNVKVSNPANGSSDPATEVSAWQRLRLEFSGSVSPGHCAGDSFAFKLPEQLQMPAHTYPLKASDGATVATMVVSEAGNVTVSLTEYVESHTEVSLNGWFEAQLNDAAKPGETADLVWNINNRTLHTPVTIKTCEGCNQMPTWASKWGDYDEATGLIKVNLGLPMATKEGQQFTFSDVLTSPGQQFDCPVSVSSVIYSSVTVSGEPGEYIAGPKPTITDCSSTRIAGTISLPEGFAGRITFTERVTDPSLGSWDDAATITSQGQSWEAKNTSKSYSGGGGGTGDMPGSSATQTEGPIVAPSGSATEAGPTSTPSDDQTQTVDSTVAPSGAATDPLTPVETQTETSDATASASGAPSDLETTMAAAADSSASGTTTVPAGVLGPDNIAVSSGGATLPHTGVEIASAAGVGGVLVAAGAAMVTSGRRRHDGSHS